MKKAPEGRVSLRIDFGGAEALLAFVDDLRQLGYLSDSDDAYQITALDNGRRGGVTPKNQFIVRTAEDVISLPDERLRDMVVSRPVTVEQARR